MTTLRFCQECNNLLYPEEDRTNHVLLYSCRNCDYREEAANHLVYRNDLMSISQEQPGQTEGLVADPTLARIQQRCPHCSNEEATMFQDQSKRIYNRMILFFVCTHCQRLYTDPGVKRRPNVVAAPGNDMESF